jgi:hypothetical protein
MDAAGALQELAGPSQRGDRVKVAIERAARLAGLTYWRAFDIWYGKARRIEQFEADAIADALRAKREKATANELQELKIRLARMESMLAQIDADFYRPQIDIARSHLRQMGGKSSGNDSSMD